MSYSEALHMTGNTVDVRILGSLCTTAFSCVSERCMSVVTLAVMLQPNSHGLVLLHALPLTVLMSTTTLTGVCSRCQG
jgi:hypothetical protein